MYPAPHIHNFRAEEVVSDDDAAIRSGEVEFDEFGSVALVVGSEGQPFSVEASFAFGHLFSFIVITVDELAVVLCSSSLASASALASMDLLVRTVNFVVFC